MCKRKTQKGYVLLTVMVISFLISLSVVATFSIVIRYMTLTRDSAEDLQSEVYQGVVVEEDPLNG